MPYLRKYGVAAQIDGIPLITKGAVDFKAAPTLAAGDVTIEKDGVGPTNIEGADAFASYVAVLPAAGRSVQVKTHITDMQCRTLVIRFVDQTSPKEWEDQEVIVETFGHASAMHPGIDLTNADSLGLVNLDALVSDAVAAGAAAEAAVNALDLSNLDVAVSTRNAVAPDNAGIAAIQAKTDNLPGSPAAVGSEMALSAAARTTLVDAIWAKVVTGAITAQAALVAIYNKALQLTFGTVNRVDATVIDKTGFALTAAYDRAKNAASAAEVAALGTTITVPGIQAPPTATALTMDGGGHYSWLAYLDSWVDGDTYLFTVKHAGSLRDVDGIDPLELVFTPSGARWVATITLTVPDAGEYVGGVGWWNAAGEYQRQLLDWTITSRTPTPTAADLPAAE